MWDVQDIAAGPARKSGSVPVTTKFKYLDESSVSGITVCPLGHRPQHTRVDTSHAHASNAQQCTTRTQQVQAHLLHNTHMGTAMPGSVTPKPPAPTPSGTLAALHASSGAVTFNVQPGEGRAERRASIHESRSTGTAVHRCSEAIH